MPKEKHELGKDYYDAIGGFSDIVTSMKSAHVNDNDAWWNTVFENTLAAEGGDLQALETVKNALLYNELNYKELQRTDVRNGQGHLYGLLSKLQETSGIDFDLNIIEGFVPGQKEAYEKNAGLRVPGEEKPEMQADQPEDLFNIEPEEIKEEARREYIPKNRPSLDEEPEKKQEAPKAEAPKAEAPKVNDKAAQFLEKMSNSHLKMYTKYDLSKAAVQKTFWGQKYQDPKSRGTEKGHGSYSVNRSAAESCSIYSLAMTGKYTLDQLMDPEQLKEEKEKAYDEVMQRMAHKPTKESQRWIAEKFYNGEIAVQKMLDQAVAEIDFEDPNLFQNKKFCQAACLAYAQFDIGQEMSHCRDEMAEIAKKHDPSIKDFDDYHAPTIKEKASPLQLYVAAMDGMKKGLEYLNDPNFSFDFTFGQIAGANNHCNYITDFIAKKKKECGNLPSSEWLSFEDRTELMLVHAKGSEAFNKKAYFMNNNQAAQDKALDMLSDGSFQKLVTGHYDAKKEVFEVHGSLDWFRQPELLDKEMEERKYDTPKTKHIRDTISSTAKEGLMSLADAVKFMAADSKTHKKPSATYTRFAEEMKKLSKLNPYTASPEDLLAQMKQAADAAEEYHTAHTGIKHPLTGWKDNARERIASSELTANVLREKIAALEPMVQQLAEQKFQDKKNAFADEAATKWLKTKYEQSLEAHIAQHPEYTEQQRQNVRNDSQSLENYIMEEKSSVLKDRKFKQFIDSIKDEESLKNMKELSDGKLFHTINNYWKTRPVDLDAEIAIAQGEIRTMTARNNGMIPEKEQMKQPLAVITAAYQVKSAQKNGISQNMTAGEFADLKAKYAKESPTFVEMFDRSDSQTLHNQATKDKGQNLMTNFINTMRIVLEEKAVDKENQKALENAKQLENNKQRRVKGGA